MTDKPKLRWYQFSLRTLLILVTLAAVVCSWYAVEMQQAAKRRAAIDKIEKLGGSVKYYDASDPNAPGEPLRWFSWFRRLHGDEYLGNAVAADFVFVSPLNIDAGLLHLRSLPEVEVLWFSDLQVTDEDVKALQQEFPNCRIIREVLP